MDQSAKRLCWDLCGAAGLRTSSTAAASTLPRSAAVGRIGHQGLRLVLVQALGRLVFSHLRVAFQASRSEPLVLVFSRHVEARSQAQ